MANEITFDFTTGLNLYFCCFQKSGDVFLTGGASDEAWGTGGRIAADYAEIMTETAAGSRHYKGSIAGGVGAGIYDIVVYHRVGGTPVNADLVIGKGEIFWDGTIEVHITPASLDVLADAVHDEVVEGTITLRQAMRLFLSVLTGKASGGGSSELKFRDVGDTKDRITAAVDENGNRTNVVRDGT